MSYTMTSDETVIDCHSTVSSYLLLTLLFIVGQIINNSDVTDVDIHVWLPPLGNSFTDFINTKQY